MSNADIPSFPDFGKLVPGFDFLQNLTKQAAGGTTKSAPQLPNLGGWLAPTLNVEELDKRIQELKTVQFWLDQNATALKATIQALELQRMTLATLKGMNFSMSEVANAFTLKAADSEPGKTTTFAGLEIPPSAFQASQASAAPSAEPGAAVSADAQASQTEPEPDKAPAAVGGMVDPMQWWGALTQQFQTIAAEAMKDAAKKAAMDSSTRVANGLAKGMAESASKTMAGGARAADTAPRSGQARPQPAADKISMRPAAKAAPKSKTKAKAKTKAPAHKTTG